MKTKRRIKNYMVIDLYEICDITGSYETTFLVYRNNKYLGLDIFR